jgi:hypothetical protein
MHRRDLTPAAPPRVIHYIEPAPRTGAVVYYDPAEVAQRRQRDLDAIRRWQFRQAQIREHDRKVRRFWLGFGAIVGTGVLAGLAWLAWLIYDATRALNIGAVLGALVGLLILGGLAAGARRCITIVQHWH